MGVWVRDCSSKSYDDSVVKGSLTTDRTNYQAAVQLLQKVQQLSQNLRQFTEQEAKKSKRVLKNLRNRDKQGELDCGATVANNATVQE